MTFLQILWFILIAVLWSGFLVLEGFDFGVGMLLRVVGKTEQERTILTKTIGPTWDGNEVWLLTAGGATFAAFPEWYATMFSGMYLPLFLILLALIIRICALEWRSKVNSTKWRAGWDWAHNIAAFLPAILFGVAFANLVQGMDIRVLDGGGRVVEASQISSQMGTATHELVGGFFSLLTPFTLLGGIVTCSLFLMHGAIFISLRTTDQLRARAQALAFKLAILATAATGVWAIWAQLLKPSTVWGWVPLVITALLLVGVVITTAAKREGWAFLMSAVAIVGAVAFIFVDMAPDVMRSSFLADAATGVSAHSLTIAGASSSPATLLVMTIVAGCLVPVVLAYQAWSYWIFRKRITADAIDPEAGLHPTAIRLGANFLAG